MPSTRRMYTPPPPQDLTEDPLLQTLPRDDAGRPTIANIPLAAKLGGGGMGAVYYGMHRLLQVERAVKILPTHLAEDDPVLIKRFLNEARSMVRLQSDHLAKIFDVSEEYGLHYLIMEYIAGITAQRYVHNCLSESGNGLDEKEALMIAHSVVTGLSEAHGLGIIHRDVKPENILIPVDMRTGALRFNAAKLVDLGLAKMADEGPVGEGLTLGDIGMGTPGYMAPEQALSARSAGPAADLYSVGATLYALMTGHAPFEGSTYSAVMKSIQEPPPPLRLRCPGASLEACEIVDRCLAKDPAERYADAESLLDAIASIIGFARDGESEDEMFVVVDRIPDVEAIEASIRQWTELATESLEAGKLDTARNFLERVLELDADNSEALRLLVMVERSASRRMQAIPFSEGSGSVDVKKTRRERGESHPMPGVPSEPDTPPPTQPPRPQGRAQDASRRLAAQRITEGPYEVMHILAGHEKYVASAAFRDNGEQIVTASRDGAARIWNVESGRPERILRYGNDGLEHASFSPAGLRVVTAGRDGTVRVWDTESGKAILEMKGHTDRVWTAHFDPAGEYVVSASSDHTARTWDAYTGKTLNVLSDHTNTTWSAVYNENSLLVLTASSGGVRLWDAKDGRLIKTFLGHTRSVECASFRPDGLRIVSASRDKTARIWDIETEQTLHELTGHRARVAFAAFSSDGKRIITGSDDRTARIWDAETGEALYRLRGHHKSVYTAGFSPDGRYVVTASSDRTARIWRDTSYQA